MFSEVCDEYYSKGISVIPANGKRVPVDNFGRYSHKLPDKAEIEFFKTRFRNHNIGVMMGPINGLMVLDVDTDDKRVMQFIHQNVPKTNVKKFGKKGMTLFYKAVRKTNAMYISKEGGCQLEFLCSSRYTVIPPSIHPETKRPYNWVGQDLLTGFDDIPEITENHLDKIDNYLREKHDCITLKEYRERM